MSLQKRLDTLKQEFSRNVPAEKLAIMNQETEKLIASDVVSKAIKVGQTVPDARLTAINGESVTIDQLIDSKPLVISFYRGGWCPYCVLELKELEAVSAEIRDLGANIIAMTPESVSSCGFNR